MKILNHGSRVASAVSILAILLSLEFGPAAGQTFVASLTLGPGQAPRAAGIDTVHGFAYFGTATDPGMVIKVSLSTFTVVATLAMPFDYVSSALIDPASGFAYFGSRGAAVVAKVSLSSFTVVATTSTFNFNRDGVLDTIHGFAYFAGTGGSVSRIRLSDFTPDGHVELADAELFSASIDPVAGFAYFDTAFQTPTVVFKIRLSDFTVVDKLSLNSGVGEPVIDTVNGFLYYGSFGSPAKIFKIGLSHFDRLDQLTLTTGQNLLEGAVIDTSRGFAYFAGDGPSSGYVVKISLSTFTEVGAVTLTGLSGSTPGATIDTTAGFAYFGFGCFFCPTPGTVVKIAE